MNAIVGMSELILREQISPIIHGYIMNIKQASTNLLAIINDILDFSKIESGKTEIVTADYLFSSLLNDVISVIRMKIMEKPIELIIEVDGNIPNNLHGDAVRIRQVLMNILSNASKYTERGSITMTIQGTVTPDSVALLSISVADTGIGIKETDIPKLFGNFVQVDTTKNRGIEGTGLGLAISKTLCNLMGGDIAFSSVYGKGSVFTVEIPQKICGDTVIARVEDPETKPVLLYEPQDSAAKVIITALKNLGVPHAWVQLQSKFYEELLENKYAYIFAAYSVLEGVLRVAEKMKLDAKIVVMTEYGVQVHAPNVHHIFFPIHTMIVANVLNNSTEFSGVQDAEAIRFIAPDVRALIVDDIMTNLIVAQGLIEPYRLKMDLAKSGQEAIDLAKENRYDIIFMDHMMPEMDGIEATARIRELDTGDGYYKDMPIIALTANAVSGMKEMFIKNGLTDFLAKPIELAKLNHILDKWISNDKKQPLEDAEELEELESDDSGPAVEPETIEIAGIDVKTGMSMTGNSLRNYLASLDSYVKDGTEKLGEIRTALEEGKIPLYTTYVHAMKSASASIGAKELSEKAKALEAAGKENNLAYIKANNEPFLAELDGAIANIRAALDAREGQSGGETEGSDPELIRKELLALREALDAMDMQRSDQLLKEITARKWDKPLAETLQNLTQCILLSDFDEAIELIDGLFEKK
jgi:CheY-like chemotaxis protein